MPAFVLIRVAVPSHELARRIAAELLGSRLAASVHIIGPVETLYWWQDAVHEGREYSCEIRTRADRRADIEALIRRLHPYELPELLTLDIDVSDPALRDWIDTYSRGSDST